MQMRTQLEEYQTQIQTLQSSYLRKMELMEVRIRIMDSVPPSSVICVAREFLAHRQRN